jgi:hypothetical protein
LSSYKNLTHRKLAEERYYNGSIPDYLLDPEDRRAKKKAMNEALYE